MRALTRDRRQGRRPAWRDRVEVVEGDATSKDTLDRALAGVDVAYYFLHSMDGEGGFVERDRDLARTFGAGRRRMPASAASSTSPGSTRTRNR